MTNGATQAGDVDIRGPIHAIRRARMLRRRRWLVGVAFTAIAEGMLTALALGIARGGGGSFDMTWRTINYVVLGAAGGVGTLLFVVAVIIGLGRWAEFWE